MKPGSVIPGLATSSSSYLALILAVAHGSFGCHPKSSQDSTFRIIATDAGFEAPNTIPAGMRHIVMENRGTEIHEAMLVKLPPGTTADDYVAAVKSGSLFPKGALDYSGPGLLSPGESTELWLKVDPGNYLLICWNQKHARTVSPHSFTVTNLLANDDLPKEDVVVKLVDYRFDIQGELRSGAQVIRIETPGPSMHEMDVYRLHDGKTVADVVRWRKDGGVGESPADALGGVLDSHDLQRIVWLRRNFTPGRYLLHCEMPLETSAEPTKQETNHADLGMVRPFEVKP
jgi:hypothetical protein